MEKVNKKFKNLELGFLSFQTSKGFALKKGWGRGVFKEFLGGDVLLEAYNEIYCGFIFRAVIKRWGPGISPNYYEHVPWLLSSGNRKEIEPKGIPSCFIPSLLVVLFTWRLEIVVTSQILLPYT